MIAKFLPVMICLVMIFPAVVNGNLKAGQTSDTQYSLYEENGLQWWEYTGRDMNRNKIEDTLETFMTTYTNITVLVDYLHKPVAKDINALKAVGGRIKYVYEYTYTIALNISYDKLESISLLPDVIFIEQDMVMHALLDSSVPSMNVDKVWDNYGLYGDGVTIAIIDTGIDASHVGLDDLNDDGNTSDKKVIAFYDVVKSATVTNGSMKPYDDNGHGSHCAGIASGTGAPYYKYRGVAPNSTLVGVKVLDSTGSGYESDVIKGVEWVMDNSKKYNIRIISLSLGAPGYYPINNDGTSDLSRTLDMAVESNICVSVAAGNNGKQWPLLGNNPGNPDRWGSISIPGDSREAITVGAVTDAYQRIWFSSIGPAGTLKVPYNKPDVCAVGVDVYSVKANSGNRYTEYSGTSMAAPHIAGIIALMLENNPSLTPGDVKKSLETTSIAGEANKINGNGNPNDYYGYGTVNANASVGKIYINNSNANTSSLHETSVVTNTLENYGSTANSIITEATQDYTTTIIAIGIISILTLIIISIYNERYEKKGIRK